MLILRWAAIPVEITEGDLEPTVPGSVVLSLLTALFLHSDLLHLVANLFYLAVFAPSVERAVGRWAFLALYLVGGAVGGLAQVAMYPSSLVPVIGASSAIAAVMAAHLVLFPRLSIEVALFAMWFAQDVLYGFKMPHALDAWLGGTATWAHLAGLSFGGSMALLWRRALVRRHPA